MSSSVNASRIVGLLLVLMAAMVVLSGPVAEALDLPSPVAEAKKKHKKKKKNRPHAFNVVQCAEVSFTCTGTAGNDFLVGTPGSEEIFGEEGNDVYQANGGNTFLTDRSATSSDSYTAVDPGAGRNTVITDSGGSADFLDMGSFRALDDFTFIILGDELVLDGPELRRVRVEKHFGPGRVEFIRFANGTLTGSQVENLARETTPAERAAFEEQSSSSEGAT